MKRFPRSVALALIATVTATVWVAGAEAGAASELRPAFVGGKLSSKFRRAESLPPNGGFENSLVGWAGYNATLSIVSPGASGAAARVVLEGAAEDFSIYPTARPVTSTAAGAVYDARASVRSLTPGLRICLRIREWAGDSVVGSAQACAMSTSEWQLLPAFGYSVVGGGHELDIYAYALSVGANDSFDVDEISLAVSAGRTPPPPPPPPPPAIGLTATAVDHAHIRLDWAAVSGAASYRVSRGALAVGTTTDTTFTDTLLWAQSSYAYRVEALSASGATLSAVSGSAATSVLPAGGFPRPFAANGVWNKPIGAAPLHPRSAALAAFFASHAINPNLTFYSYGVSVSETRPSDPLQSVPCIRFVNCTLGAFGSFRIPTTAQADPSSDGHLAIYDPVAGREWDMWQAWKSGDSWSAGAGAAVSMSGDGIAAANTASGNAANFPLLGGIVRPEELLQGRIDHALVFMMPQVSNLGRVCPATHSVGDTSHPDALKQGTRIQLDPGLNVDSLAIPAWQKTIGRALQVYGAYLRDSSSSLAIIGENPISRGYDAWALVGLGEPNAGLMRGFPWDRFRVLDAATNC
ncbi:MAG: hypothetical protein H0V84_08850 [Actinobacteria bacterium]|nr:hypothetical protein [Actinomycetota bacterium]